MRNPNDEYDPEPIDWKQRVMTCSTRESRIMNIYTGSFDNENWYQVFKNGLLLDYEPSLKIRNHSPTGFAFGYGDLVLHSLV